MQHYSSFLFLLSFLAIFVAALPRARSVGGDDAEALLGLKVSIDPLNVLQWSRERSGDVCNWEGVKECLNGRVSKLVLERLNLSGTLDGKSLNQLDQLRVLSFKENSLSGQIPSLSGLANLKSLFLNNNKFSGDFPASIAVLHRLKVLVLSENKIRGEIPESAVKLSRLYVLYLQDNLLTGEIPPLNQTSLKFFNVSNNQLSGQIPATSALSQFNVSSFSGNIDLCGGVIQKQCSNFGPSTSPSYPILPPNKGSSRNHKKKLILILVPSIVGGLLIFLTVIAILMVCSRNSRTTRTGPSSGNKVAGGGLERGEEATATSSGGGGAATGDNAGKQGGFSWDQGGEGLGKLVFCGPGDQQMNYSLEDLLKASAETLGRGTVGSTYKAVMESGYIVTVKRLKEARYPRIEEFRGHVEVLGRLRHPNLVPLRAYFQAKEERLLVYDYFPNGSLFSLIHGKSCSCLIYFFEFAHLDSWIICF